MLFKDKIKAKYILASFDLKTFLDEYYEFADVDDYEWHYEDKYPVTKLCQSPYINKQQWLSWLENERNDAIDQFGDDRYYDRLSATSTYPIIITDRDSKHAVDGNHRIALALEKGQTTIPAVIGYKK